MNTSEVTAIVYIADTSWLHNQHRFNIKSRVYFFAVTEKVSQVAISPLSIPLRSQTVRCSDDPWVNDSGDNEL